MQELKKAKKYFKRYCKNYGIKGSINKNQLYIYLKFYSYFIHVEIHKKVLLTCP